MAEGKSAGRTIFSILLITATGAGLYNVFSDNAAVISMAEAAACGKEHCSVQMTRMSRSPIGQTFTFQTSLREKGASSSTAEVECRRAYYLVGDYGCVRAGANNGN
jgi:hypothetical protein